MIILSIIGFIFTLGLVILIHELGHFVMAKRAGILCHEFSIGMGPILYSKKKGETVYSIRWIPIGGYVSMAGEEIDDSMLEVGMSIVPVIEEGMITEIQLNPSEDSENLWMIESFDLKDSSQLHINGHPVKVDAHYVLNNGKKMQIAPTDRLFSSKTILERFLAIFAGPFMNFVLAFAVFIVIALFSGFPVEESTEIGGINLGFPAEGLLEEGDFIVTVNHQFVSDWTSFQEVMKETLGDRNIPIQVLRNDTPIEITINPRLFFYSVGFSSHKEAINELRIGPVVDNTLAFQAGFLENDIIQTINGEAVSTWKEMVTIMEANRTGQLMVFEIERDGTTRTLSVTPYEEALLKTQNIGIVESFIGVSPTSEFSLINSLGAGFTGVAGASRLITDTLGLLFSSSSVGVGDLAGPIGIFTITAQSLSRGLLSFLGWIGLLSVNLGIINLLPIPALDGGRLVFLGVEAVTRKKINPKLENMLHTIMFILLMGFFLYVTFNDLLRLFN